VSEPASEPRPQGGVDALVALGIPAERANLFVDEDMVVEVAGKVLLVSFDEEEMTGKSRAVVALGVETLLDDDAAMAALRAELSARAGRLDAIVCRLGPESEPPDTLGARLISRYLTAGPAVPIVEPTGRWSVRPYRPDDHDVVADLLLEAIHEGYRIVGDGPLDGGPESFVESLLARVGGEVDVFVSHHGRDFAGHVTLMVEQDDLTGQTQLELFDMFVLHEWRGTEAGKLLTSSAVLAARERGLALRGHVAGDNANAAAVTARLLASGWHRAESYWSLPGSVP
jgi:GNAT superfamily N-acetyltransferase